MTLLVLIALIVVIAVAAWLLWPSIAPYVRDSETLFAARAMTGVGLVVGILVQVSPDQVGALLTATGLGPYAPAAVAVLGIVTELARKNRATDL